MDGMAGPEVVWAMEQGDEDHAEALLREDPSAVRYLGYYREWVYENFSLLHGAAWYDCPRMARLLLEMGANKDALSWVYTPLEFAVQHGHEEVISILLQAGADPHSIRGGNTLICAAQAELRSESQEDTQRHFHMLKMALEYVGRQHINAQSRYSVTAVQAACRNGTAEVVRSLVEQGADLTIPDKQGRTPRDKVMDCIREIEAADPCGTARLRRYREIHALLLGYAQEYERFCLLHKMRHIYDTTRAHKASTAGLMTPSPSYRPPAYVNVRMEAGGEATLPSVEINTAETVAEQLGSEGAGTEEQTPQVLTHVVTSLDHNCFLQLMGML